MWTILLVSVYIVKKGIVHRAMLRIKIRNYICTAVVMINFVYFVNVSSGGRLALIGKQAIRHASAIPTNLVLRH